MQLLNMMAQNLTSLTSLSIGYISSWRNDKFLEFFSATALKYVNNSLCVCSLRVDYSVFLLSLSLSLFLSLFPLSQFLFSSCSLHSKARCFYDSPTFEELIVNGADVRLRLM